MEFTKVKYSRSEKKVELAWETKEGAAKKDTVTHNLKSFDPPHPDLVAAMDAFKDPVLEFLELHSQYGVGLEVRGFSINHEEDGRCGLVITCLKELDEANAPLVLNTPHLREYKDEEFSEGFMPSDWMTKLDRLQAEAREYLNGKREQGDLFQQEKEGTTITFSTADGKKVTCTPKQLQTATKLAELRRLHAMNALPSGLKQALKKEGFWHLVEDAEKGELELV